MGPCEWLRNQRALDRESIDDGRIVEALGDDHTFPVFHRVILKERRDAKRAAQNPALMSLSGSSQLMLAAIASIAPTHLPRTTGEKASDRASSIVNSIDEPLRRIEVAIHAIDAAIGERQLVIIATKIAGRLYRKLWRRG